MRPVLLAFVLVGASAQAQPAALNGLYLNVGPSATAGSLGGASVQAGPGLTVETGWTGRRVGVFLGATGGGVANAPAFWSRLGDAEARTNAEAATRSTLASFDAGIDVNLGGTGARTVPFVGASYSRPVYATEGAADRRVTVSGAAMSPRLGVRHEVTPGIGVSGSVAVLVGSLGTARLGDDGTGRQVEIESSRLRGAHVQVGLVFRPFAWASALDAREAARLSAP